MKRVFLFVATNLAVLIVLGTTVHLLGFNQFLGAQGIDFAALIGFAAVFGFGGAFISLLMSKWVAKKSTGARVIERPANHIEAWLLDTVRHQAKRAGIKTPEVAVYESPEVNAFATGPSKNNSLVAVSSGLLQTMRQEEAEAVLAHEVSHIANGDMVTLTLIQGVVNTFVIAIARVAGYTVDRFLAGNSDEEYQGPGIAYYVTSIAAEIFMGILASIIVMWFSRRREYRADAGGAQLAGRDKMIAALERLRQVHVPSRLPNQVAAFGIKGGASRLGSLFTSHPPLEARIAALRASR